MATAPPPHTSSSSSSSKPRCGTVNREGAPKWVNVPTRVSPQGRIGHTLCANTEEDKVILYGGVTDCEDGSSQKYLDDYFIYDFNAKEWERIEVTGVRQQPRAFHTSVFWDDKIYVFGGCNGRGRFNRLFSIDLEGKCEQPDVSSSPATPATRYCHSATVFNKGMYVFGGKCGGRNSNKRLSDMWVYNFEAKLWSEVPQTGDLPSPRSAHAAFTYGRTMVVFGGRSEVGECCEDLYYYHYDTRVWTRVNITESLFGRARHSFVVHHSRVVVFGGWNGKKKLNDLFYYNMDSGIFEVVGDTDENGPSRRECHMAVMCKNTMVVFGGRFRNDFMNATSELELSAMSLKEHCRSWLMLQDTPRAAIATVQRKTVPLRLQQFLASYNTFFVEKEPPPMPPPRPSLPSSGPLPASAQLGPIPASAQQIPFHTSSPAPPE